MFQLYLFLGVWTFQFTASLTATSLPITCLFCMGVMGNWSGVRREWRLEQTGGHCAQWVKYAVVLHQSVGAVSHRGPWRQVTHSLAALTLGFSISMPSCPQSLPTCMASTRMPRSAFLPRYQKSSSERCWRCSLGTTKLEMEPALQGKKRCVVGIAWDSLGTPKACKEDAFFH